VAKRKVAENIVATVILKNVAAVGGDTAHLLRQTADDIERGETEGAIIHAGRWCGWFETVYKTVEDET
jgi:hypothetical protein